MLPTTYADSMTPSEFGSSLVMCKLVPSRTGPELWAPMGDGLEWTGVRHNGLRESEKHSRVLIYLANRDGPATKYEIEKNISPEIDHSTLYEVISNLKATGSIKVVKTGKSRVGLTMEYYDLGLAGVIGAIQQDTIRAMRSGRWDNFLLDIDALSSKYKSYLPLIFGKWELFKKKGPPSLWLRVCSYAAFDWANWLEDIIKSRKGKNSSTLAAEFRSLMKDESDTKGLLEGLESELRTRLYVGFFNVTIAKRTNDSVTNIMGRIAAFLLQREIEEGASNLMYAEPFWKKIHVESEGLERIWAKDPEIRRWIIDQLTHFTSFFLLYSKLFDAKKKQFEALGKNTPVKH